MNCLQATQNLAKSYFSASKAQSKQSLPSFSSADWEPGNSRSVEAFLYKKPSQSDFRPALTALSPKIQCMRTLKIIPCKLSEGETETSKERMGRGGPHLRYSTHSWLIDASPATGSSANAWLRSKAQINSALATCSDSGKGITVFPVLSGLLPSCKPYKTLETQQRTAEWQGKRTHESACLTSSVQSVLESGALRYEKSSSAAAQLFL